jgi:hypothetical protein
MGKNLQMSQGDTEPVDATSMHEWEADRANRFGAGLLFWCWYLPNDVIRWRGAFRATIRTLIRGHALLRYPPIIAPARRVELRSPVRFR